jgi:hypothetical protein
MMYCYNEKTVDVKRGKRGKTIVFPNILSWQVLDLGGRGCRRVWSKVPRVVILAMIVRVSARVGCCGHAEFFQSY